MFIGETSPELLKVFFTHPVYVTKTTREQLQLSTIRPCDFLKQKFHLLNFTLWDSVTGWITKAEIDFFLDA